MDWSGQILQVIFQVKGTISPNAQLFMLRKLFLPAFPTLFVSSREVIGLTVKDILRKGL